MPASIRKISLRGWLKLASWTFFGTLGCLAVSLTFNWLAFRHMSPQALRQGLISAIVLPVILAGPLFFYLTLKLRELAIVNHMLNDLASVDGLTGCLNRRAFMALVEHRLDGPPKRLAKGALLVIDADHFKSINDRYGHDRGDEALQLIARSIRSVLRSDDRVGRLGGEEFGVFLSHASLGDAAEVAERIRTSVGNASFEPGDKRHPLSVSVGCAAFAQPIGFRELFRLADESLYAAKHRGRNRVEIASAPPLAPEFERMAKLG